jgi:hypothetical protein
MTVVPDSQRRGALAPNAADGVVARRWANCVVLPNGGVPPEACRQ